MSTKRNSKLLNSITNVLRKRVISRKRTAMLTNKSIAKYTWELAFEEEFKNKNMIVETHKNVNYVMLKHVAILLSEQEKLFKFLEKKYVKGINKIYDVVDYRGLYTLYDRIFYMLNIKDNSNKLAYITKKGLNDIWFSKDKNTHEIIEIMYEHAVNINNAVNEYIINDRIMERAETNAINLFKCALNILRLINTNADITLESNKYTIYKKEEKEILVHLNKVKNNAGKIKKNIIDNVEKSKNNYDIKYKYMPMANHLIQNAMKHPTYTNTQTTISL